MEVHYKSKRNQVRQIPAEPGLVYKVFAEKEACLREKTIYEKLFGSALPHASVVRSGEDSLVMTCLPGKDLVEVLEKQEESGSMDWSVWQKLVEWVIGFCEITGFVMADANLRNFIYDENVQILYGVDFEDCAEGDIRQTAAQIAAYILHYAPENTDTKKEIAQYVLHRFSQHLDLDMEDLISETEKQEIALLERRKKKA